MSDETQPGRRWSDQRGWLIALIVALVLQGIVVWRSELVARDGIDFIRYAQNLPVRGVELIRAQDQHPGFPLLIWGSATLLRPLADSDNALWFAAARLPAFVSGLGSVIVVWLLTRRLFDRWTADVAALVFAALPIFRQNAADGLSDSPHMFFYLLAAWLASEGLTRMSWPWWAGVGAASAAAYWIRPEGLAVALVAGITLVLLALVRRGRQPWQLAACTGALTLAVLLLALPYPLMSGKFTSKQNPYAQQQPKTPYLINKARDEQQNPTAAPTGGSQPLAAAPAELLKPVAAAAPGPAPEPPITANFLFKTLGRALIEFGDEIVRGFRFYFLVFYLLGYFELRRRELDYKLFVFLYGLATLHILVLLGVFFMSGYISHRHVMPLVALGMPWVALGMIYAGGLLKRFARLPGSPELVVATVAVVSCAIVVPRSARELHAVFRPAVDAADWVRERSKPGDRVVSNSKYVSYFSGRPTVMLNERTPTIQAALTRAEVSDGYQFAVIDLGEDGFQEGWLKELKTASHPLLQLDAVVRGESRARMLVLETNAHVATPVVQPIPVLQRAAVPVEPLR